MGLDGVELVLAFEEQFGIEISDAEAELMTTPSKVITYITGKLNDVDDEVCQSQRSFYLLRRGVIKVLGIKRNELTPATKLREFHPSNDASSWWVQLKEAVGANLWPSLERPRYVVALISFISFLATIVSMYILLSINVENSAALPVVGLVVFGLVAAILTYCTKPMCQVIPSKIATLANLVPYTATSKSIQWSEELIRLTVKAIILEQLGIKESKYSEDAHFFKDLGVD